MKKIMVIGAGTMGADIALSAALSGYQVVLKDIKSCFVEKGLERIKKSLTKMINKDKINAKEKEIILNRILGTTELNDGKDVDIVIEAIIENIEVKKKLFKEMDEIINKDAIFASNTSSLSITALGAATNRYDKVIGMHFFNPVSMMKLVEVVKGVATSKETFETTYKLAQKLGKTPIEIEEAPGFVVNRILVPMINEAVFLLMEGVASIEDIDKAMKLGANHPIGPIALADMIGLDICLAVMEILYKETGDSKYRPCPLLRKMVRAGHLGRKNKKGFYEY